MSEAIVQAVQRAQLKTNLPRISVGDTVDVHVKIIEGAKERIQIFAGVVIKMQGGGLEQNMTVRRIVANEGVERTFPLHSPRIAKIEIVRHGHIRRSKLYYLRERVGKKRRLRDRQRGLGREIEMKEPPPEAALATGERPVEAEVDDDPPAKAEAGNQ